MKKLLILLLSLTTMIAAIPALAADYTFGIDGTSYVERMNNTIKVYASEKLPSFKVGASHFAVASARGGNVILAAHNGSNSAFFLFVKDMTIEMNIAEISLAALYLVWNIFVFFLYGADKRKARRGDWRISETALIMSAILMGGIGAFLGMKIFRHKTKHLKFKILLPLAILLNISVITAVIYFFVKHGF